MLKKGVILFFLATCLAFSFPAAVQSSECVEFGGFVTGIGENTIEIENSLGIFQIAEINNLEVYHLPLLAAAEQRRPIYIQLQSKEGTTKIIFMRGPFPPKSKASEY